MSISFIPCPLWPDNNRNSVTALYVNILKLSFFTGERVFKYFNIISGSHVQFVLGFAGLKLNAPFINLVTNRCSPAGLPSIDIILDKLLLAVFNALYPKPSLCKIVRNSKISWDCWAVNVYIFPHYKVSPFLQITLILFFRTVLPSVHNNVQSVFRYSRLPELFPERSPTTSFIFGSSLSSLHGCVSLGRLGPFWKV